MAAAAVTLPLPRASRDTVRFWQIAVGAIASPTVMVMTLLVMLTGIAQGSLEVTTQVTWLPLTRVELA